MAGQMDCRIPVNKGRFTEARIMGELRQAVGGMPLPYLGKNGEDSHSLRSITHSHPHLERIALDHKAPKVKESEKWRNTCFVKKSFHRAFVA